MPKPELGPIAVSDKLIVIVPTYSSRRDDAKVNVVVTKASRVWIELTEVEQVRSMARTWRMRRDTQNDGNGRYGPRFVTPEQHDWEGRVHAAWKELTSAGINPTGSSLWRTDEDRFLALADFLRAYNAEHPAS